MNLVRRLEECRDSVTHCGELAAMSPMIYTRSVLWAVDALVSSLTDPAMSVEDKEPLACLLRSLIRSYRGSADEIDKKVKMDLNVKSLLYRLSTFIRTPNDDTLLPLVENLENRDIVTELGDNSGQLDRLCAQMTLFLPRGPRMRHPDNVQARLDSLRASNDQKKVEISLLERELARAEDRIDQLNQQITVTVNVPAIANASQQGAPGLCNCGAEAELEQAKKRIHEQRDEYAELMLIYERKESELKNSIEHATLLEAEIVTLNRQLRGSLGANDGVTVSVALDRAAQLTTEMVNLQAELNIASTKLRVQEREHTKSVEKIKCLQSQLADCVVQNVNGNPPVPRAASTLKGDGAKVSGAGVAVAGGSEKLSAEEKKYMEAEKRQLDEYGRRLEVAAAANDAAKAARIAVGVSLPVTVPQVQSSTLPSILAQAKEQLDKPIATRARHSSGSDMDDSSRPKKIVLRGGGALNVAKDKDSKKKTEDSNGETDLSQTTRPIQNILALCPKDKRDELDVEMDDKDDNEDDWGAADDASRSRLIDDASQQSRLTDANKDDFGNNQESVRERRPAAKVPVVKKGERTTTVTPKVAIKRKSSVLDSDAADDKDQSQAVSGSKGTDVGSGSAPPEAKRSRSEVGVHAKADDQDTTDTSAKDKDSDADGAGAKDEHLVLDSTQDSGREEKEKDEEKDKPKPKRPTSGLHQELDDEMCKILEEDEED